MKDAIENILGHIDPKKHVLVEIVFLKIKSPLIFFVSNEKFSTFFQVCNNLAEMKNVRRRLHFQNFFRTFGRISSYLI